MTMKMDRYEVMCREDGSMHRLGQGATSSSYKALDLDLQTPVVLKVIRQEFLGDETARKRFLREARAAALLRHPNVAQIYRLGEEDGMCFYAREFIEGETAETMVTREGPIPPERGARCRAAGRARARGGEKDEPRSPGHQTVQFDDHAGGHR